MVGGGCFSARVRTIEGRVGNGTILLSCAPAPTFWQNSYPGHHKYGIPAPSEPVISGREVWWGGRESDLTVIRELAGSKPTVGTSRRFFFGSFVRRFGSFVRLFCVARGSFFLH